MFLLQSWQSLGFDCFHVVLRLSLFIWVLVYANMLRMERVWSACARSIYNGPDAYVHSVL
jgi:hypothetical protein